MSQKPIVKKRRSEMGIAIPFYAVFLAFLLVPLLSLTIDITRLMYVRTHLQTAADAACEAGAQALDVPTFMYTGVTRIDRSQAISLAVTSFRGTVVDAGIVEYNPALASLTLTEPTVVSCTATATVDNMIPGTPPMRVSVQTVAKMRTVKR